MMEKNDAGADEGNGNLFGLRKAVGVGLASLFLSAGAEVEEAEARVPEASSASSHFVTGKKGPPALKRRPPSSPPAVTPPKETPESLRQKEQAELLARTQLSIIMMARGQVLDIFQKTKNDYSHDLVSLQSRFTARLQSSDEAGRDQRAVFLDPMQFDISKSLGFSGLESIGNMLSYNQVHAPENLMRYLAKGMSDSYRPPVGDVPSMKTTAQAISGLADKGVDACIVIPSSHTENMDVANLSQHEKNSFINHHEGWHCLHTKYTLTKADYDALDKVGTEDLGKLLLSLPAMHAAGVMHKKETFADIGAAGDMIRQGSGVEIIDAVAAWRDQRKFDVLHYTAPGLMALKEKIVAMGVDNFRAMADKDLKGFYYQVSDAYGLSPQKFVNIAKYAEAGKEDRKKMEDAAQHDPEMAQSIYIVRTLIAPPSAPSAPPHRAGQETRSEHKKTLDAWDAEAVLKETAMKADGEITPQSLTRAYAQEQENLYALMKANPENPVYAGMAAKLKSVLETSVIWTPYMHENARRGVDIERSEVLSQFISSPASGAERGETGGSQPDHPHRHRTSTMQGPKR